MMAVGIFACALVLTGVVIRRELFSQASETAVFRVFPRPDVNLVGRVIGSEMASVPIVVFADFQCPYCADAQRTIKAILAADPDGVKILYRHLPLETIHPYAWTAALASECAGDQDAFPRYHDLLFALQDSLGELSWTDLAVRADVADTSVFDRCVSEERHAGTVERDVLLARDLGIDRTPTFVIGDEAWRGVPPASWVRKQVARARRHQKSSEPGLE